MRDTIAIPGFFEPVSSLSHLLGAVAFAVASIMLLRRGRGDSARMASLAVFCAGSVFLLLVSGIYHMLPPDSSLQVIAQRLDHAAIFVLIAASFTPIHTILFEGRARRGPLIAIWTIAAVGIVLKMVYFHDMPRWLGLGLYLGMGWLGLFSGIALWRRYGFHLVVPLCCGGIAYTVGMALEALRWPVLIDGVVQWHELFHLAVLIGLSFHWALTYRIADGHLTPSVEQPLRRAA